jgi:hypothetical protein
MALKMCEILDFLREMYFAWITEVLGKARGLFAGRNRQMSLPSLRGGL